MPTLILRFPARRYQATPWGHHVNEGLVEWPPSPWRVLRALLAAGYSSCQWQGSRPPQVACELISRLASVLPSYRLPRAVGAHTRHYMPLARLKDGREETTLVFDTWAQVDDGAMAITWDVDLSHEQNELLGKLASSLNYLGRSESWVDARLMKSDEQLPAGTASLPSENAVRPGQEWEEVSLLAPLTLESYTGWRSERVENQPEALLKESKAKGRRGRKQAISLDSGENALPEDIIDCLQVTTGWLHDRGWNQPPGSRRVFYWRRADALEVGAPPRIRVPVQASPVEAMLLALATRTGKFNALPPEVRTLPQAELFHRALVKVSAQLGGNHCVVLSGCDEQGRPLSGSHRHAHILPFDLDGDGRLDHILIWAPMGLDADAQAAVRRVRVTYMKHGAAPLRVALAGACGLDVLRRLPGEAGVGIKAILGAANRSTTWVSLTPFVAPRHLKKHGTNTLEGQVAAELASRGFPKPTEIRVMDLRENAKLLRLRHFVRARRSGPQPPVDCSFAVRLRFEQAVLGPLCLGYGSHFGLGLFKSEF